MKTINNYINEKLKINKTTIKYTYQPKNYIELREILEERLDKDKNADLNDIDVSLMTIMCTNKDKGLFEGLDPHNIDISRWDVSNVENMTHMFLGCKNFNCDLSNWDISNVENMSSMFYACKKFTGKGLENWNVFLCFINVQNLAEKD